MTWQFFPVWIHAAGPFMWKQTLWRQTKMGLQDVEFKPETWIRLFKKEKKASLWLPLSYFNLPLCCLFCVLHFVIDCSHWLWSAPGSQRVGWGSVKTNKHIKKGSCRQNPVQSRHFQVYRAVTNWGSQGVLLNKAFAFLCFKESSLSYSMSVTQCKIACSGTLKWYSEL